MNSKNDQGKSINLPDFDEIPSLHCNSGMYDVDRIGETVQDALSFLEAVKRKFGGHYKFAIIEEYDGYPGYISIRP